MTQLGFERDPATGEYRLVVKREHLIITSDNAGMFFGAETAKVFNFRTLERLLRRSDGDVALIQHVLGTYAKHADEALETSSNEFQVGSMMVAYEAVTVAQCRMRMTVGDGGSGTMPRKSVIIGNRSRTRSGPKKSASRMAGQ